MPSALLAPPCRCLTILGLLAAACAHDRVRPGDPGATPPAPIPPARSDPPPALPDPLPSLAEPAPDMGAPLARIRADADAVLRAQAEAYWRMFTEGARADPGAAWRGREELLSDRSLQLVRAARAGAPDGRRPAAFLAAWLLGERLAEGASGALREAAAAEEQARVRWADHEVPLRSVRSLLAGERDRERRRALAEAAAGVARDLLPAAERGEQRLLAVARGLGGSPLELAAELRGTPAPALAALAEEVLARTEPAWQALLEALARAEGLPRAEVRARDLPRLLRTQVPARLFPAGRHLTLSASILAGMGIDLSRQANLRIAAGPHPGAPAASIALPVDPPGDVRLAVAAVAGLDAARGVLHELGAAEYWAHLRDGPVELRRLGPAAVPEAFGVALEEVAGSAAWLASAGVPEGQARAEARAAAARRLLRARERAARVLAAVARPPDGVPGIDAALLARATGCAAEREDAIGWRLDPDPLLRAAEGLRAELLAAQLELGLARAAGGAEWWRSEAAGAWLAGAWADAAGRTPEELSASLGAKALDAGALVRVVEERAGL